MKFFLIFFSKTFLCSKIVYVNPVVTATFSVVAQAVFLPVNHSVQVSLELVRRVPEFFLYALERGITELNVQVTQSLLGQPHLTHHLAHLLAALTNFLCYVIVCYEAMNEDMLHVNVASLRETLTTLIFPRLQAVLVARAADLRFIRILLASILESCFVSELG